MDEAETQTCQNCKREIPAVNFTIHSVHCARNIRVCPVCKEPIPLAELDTHHEKLHKLLPCKQCGEKVCGTDMEDHIRDSCAHTIQSCRFCELEVRRRELPLHEGYCGARTEQCEECSEWVMLKYRQLHLDSNHGFLRLDDDPVPTPRLPTPLQRVGAPIPRMVTPMQGAGAALPRPGAPTFTHFPKLANWPKLTNPGAGFNRPDGRLDNSRNPINGYPIPIGQPNPNINPLAGTGFLNTPAGQNIPMPGVLGVDYALVNRPSDILPVGYIDMRKLRTEERAQGKSLSPGGAVKKRPAPPPPPGFAPLPEIGTSSGSVTSNPSETSGPSVGTSASAARAANLPAATFGSTARAVSTPSGASFGSTTRAATTPSAASFGSATRAATSPTASFDSTARAATSPASSFGLTARAATTPSGAGFGSAPRAATSPLAASSGSTARAATSPSAASFGSISRVATTPSGASFGSTSRAVNAALTATLIEPGPSIPMSIPNLPSRDSKPSQFINATPNTQSKPAVASGQSINKVENLESIRQKDSRQNSSRVAQRTPQDRPMENNAASSSTRNQREMRDVQCGTRDDLKNLKPMSADEFMNRFRELQMGRPPAEQADRISQIKSSLKQLRRGLNEVTAPYNINANCNNNPNNANNRRGGENALPSPREEEQSDEEGARGEDQQDLDNVRLPCEFCNTLVPAGDLVLHETGCRPDLARYAGARNPPPLDNMPPDPVIPCEFCTKPLPLYLISEHQERCGREANLLFPD